MNNYFTFQIVDLMNTVGKDYLISYLSRFSCSKNAEIENFIHFKALEFACRKQSITHLVFDKNNGNFVGFFTLTHKPITVKSEMLSKTASKNIAKHAKYDENINAYVLSAFLIAQFGKNYSLNKADQIDGSLLMDVAYKKLLEVQHQIGGGIVFLECEDNQKLLNFYTQEPNFFRIFGERFSETDGTKYIQLLRFI